MLEPLNKLIPKQIQVSDHPEVVSADRLIDDGTSEEELQMAAEQLVHILAEAVRRRVQNVPLRRVNEDSLPSLGARLQEDGTTREVTGGELPSPASVAILFSGGIDSMVLAALAAR